MTCDARPRRLQEFLRGSLSEAESRGMQDHLESCDLCQAQELVPAPLAALLRQRLQREHASEALRSRLRQALDAATERVPRQPWWQGWLASPWTPRLAMALVVALLVAIPLRELFRAPPLLAQEAVRSHVLHEPTCDGPLPGCCTDLALHEGETLPEPAAGRVIPDLRPLGFDLIITSRCAGRVEVSRLVYRDAQGRLFSLYITDQVAKQFEALYPHRAHGLLQEHYRVEGSEVTLWEQDGLVHFWIGPRGSSHEPQVLAVLQRQH